jgi:hypothetical protein
MADVQHEAQSLAERAAARRPDLVERVVRAAHTEMTTTAGATR